MTTVSKALPLPPAAAVTAALQSCHYQWSSRPAQSFEIAVPVAKSFWNPCQLCMAGTCGKIKEAGKPFPALNQLHRK